MMSFTTIMQVAGALLQATGNPEFIREGEMVFRECAEAIERGKRMEIELRRLHADLDQLRADLGDAGRVPVYPIDVAGLRLPGPGRPDAA